MAATEFALILPTALILFTGSLVYGTAIEINRKVTLTARTITDLITQYTSIDSADMTTLLNATAQVMAPFSAASTAVTITEVSTNAAGVSTVDWSYVLNANSTPKTVGSTVTLPTSIDLPNSTVVWGHVSYTYTPTIGYEVTSAIILQDDIYLNPRLSTKVLTSETGATTTAP